MTLALFTPCMTAIKLCCTQATIIVGLLKTGDFACEIAKDLSVGCFFASVLPAYFFLWKRQRIMYAQPSLKRLNTRTVNVLSYLAIGLLSVGGFGTCVLFILPFDSRISAIGCVDRESESNNELPYLLAAVVMISSQLIIFALFVHPLRLHKKNSVVVNRASSDVGKRLKRANVLATTSMTICTGSDLFSLVLRAAVLPELVPLDFVNAIYDLSLVVNILSVMLSFEDYRDIMFGIFTTSASAATIGSETEMKSRTATTTTTRSSEDGV